MNIALAVLGLVLAVAGLVLMVKAPAFQQFVLKHFDRLFFLPMPDNQREWMFEMNRRPSAVWWHRLSGVVPTTMGVMIVLGAVGLM